jgi:MFS family permease
MGVVSLLADASTHMIKPILPAFISMLGGGGLAVGSIGGVAESVTSLLKVLSGYWSDRIRRRKPFMMLGYITSAAAKMLFPLSSIWQHLLVLMPAERVGKGLRGAPRDALIAASVHESARGWGFGFHRAMDTGGAIVGSLAAYVLVAGADLSIRSILVIGGLLAFAAVAPIMAVVERPHRRDRTEPSHSGWRGLPRPLYRFLIVATVFSLGNFSYMFLILKAGDVFGPGHSLGRTILLYVLIHVAYAGLSMPAGGLSDRIGRRKVLFLGYGLFAVTCLGLSLASRWPELVLLFALYGAYRALTDGTQRALVADLVPAEIRGTALGAFHTAVGLAALPASLVAGLLWQRSPRWTFLYGAILGLTAVMLLALLGRPRGSIRPLDRT